MSIILPCLRLCRSCAVAGYYYASLPYRYWFARWARARGRMPMVVLMYHRIADDRASPWTTSTRAFRRQMAWLQHHCELVSLEGIQARMRSGYNDRLCAAITFDDGYSDNCREAIPLLIEQQIPCTYFVTLRNLLCGEPFAHDVARACAARPNTLQEVRAMAHAGVEIGAHSVTHPDFGRISDKGILYRELVGGARELEQRIGRQVRYFAFPFGLHQNLSSAAFGLARGAGFSGVCSAYGGYNLPGDDPFHLQRLNGDEDMLEFYHRVVIDPRRFRTPRFAEEGDTALLPWFGTGLRKECTGGH